MNPQLFGSGTRGPATDTKNLAGGRAYERPGKEALASYALVGTLHDTFYATAKFHLDTVLELLKDPDVDDAFVAQLAVYARRDGYMKDMPAFLVSCLAAQGSPYFRNAFRRVIDNGKMLRNFVQVIRSGVLGRKSFGTAVKRELQRWFATRTPYQLMRAIPGNNPALVDIVRMVRPRPDSAEKDAFYAWLLGRVPNLTGQDKADGRNAEKRYLLPQIVREYEAFKEGILDPKSPPLEAPNVDFRLLDFLPLPKSQWKEIARNGKWMFTRMNLNTFARHGVFEDSELTKIIADRLRNPEEIRRARQFPYQLMTAYINVKEGVPFEVKDALQDAMEVSLENVPDLQGNVFVIVDVSGSMQGDAAGKLGWCTRAGSAVRCIDVAALFGSAYLRKNPENTRIIPVDSNVKNVSLNPRDTVFTNAEKLARINGCATAMSAGVRFINTHYQKADFVIIVSDQESWADWDGNRYRYWYGSSGPATVLRGEWGKLKKKNPNAKMVMHDIQPNRTAQVRTEADILSIAGFSDQVFNVVSAFQRGDLTGEGMIRRIESVDLFSEKNIT